MPPRPLAAGADTRFLAGGQSLIQAMRLRLSQSERLVDLGAIADLKQIKADGNGVTIGAMATHASVAANADVKRIAPGDRRARRRHRRSDGEQHGNDRRLDRQRRPGGVLSGRRAGVQRDDPYRPPHDRRRRFLHRPVGDRIAARRADHRRRFPGGAEGGLRQVQAAGVALRADRRVRRARRRAAFASASPARRATRFAPPRSRTRSPRASRRRRPRR